MITARTQSGLTAPSDHEGYEIPCLPRRQLDQVPERRDTEQCDEYDRSNCRWIVMIEDILSVFIGHFMS
jgi:hypothetical protein